MLALYSYDNLGRRSGLTRGNGTVTSYGYDAVSRLSQLVQNLNGTTNDLTLDFSHSPGSQIVSNTRSNNGYSFTGHANANVSSSVNGLNQLTAVGGASVTHDARGNLDYDGSRSFGYLTDNLLVSAYPHTLLYDPLGRLIHMDVAGGVIERYGYDGQSLIAEYDVYGAVTRRYVHGPGIDEPLVWYEGSGTSTRRYFHADERGSVVAVSDASGNLVGSTPNRYDEYGVPQGTLTGRFGYTGQMWLPDAGLYYYRARMYNPRLRFMQTDPIGYGGGMNLYGYVGGDPVNATDPSGLLEVLGLKKKCINQCRGTAPTGTRIVGGGGSNTTYGTLNQNWKPGDSSGGGIETWKITDAGKIWLEARGTGMLSWLMLSTGGNAALNCPPQLSPTTCAALGDSDVRDAAIQVWANSGGDGPTGGKNEWGFWITQVGDDFRVGEYVQGSGPFIRRTSIDAAWRNLSGASIWFHVHPFYAGEIQYVGSTGLTYGDMAIARDYHALVIAIARPAGRQGRGGGYSVFNFDCRGGC